MSLNKMFGKNLTFLREETRKKYRLESLSMRAMSIRIGISYDAYLRWEKTGLVPNRTNLVLATEHFKRELPHIVGITENSLLQTDLSQRVSEESAPRKYSHLPEDIKSVPVYNVEDDILGTPREYYYCSRKILRDADFALLVPHNRFNLFGILKNDTLFFKEGASSDGGIYVLHFNDENVICRMYLTIDGKAFIVTRDGSLTLPPTAKIIGQLVQIVRQEIA